jgi:hypothetical protein
MTPFLKRREFLLSVAHYTWYRPSHWPTRIRLVRPVFWSQPPPPAATLGSLVARYLFPSLTTRPVIALVTKGAISSKADPS